MTCSLFARTSLAFIVASALFTQAAQAVDPAVQPKLVVVEGDTVPGVGNFTYIYNLAVNNDGICYVEGDTDNPTTTADYVVVRNSAANLHLQEGQLLTSPTPGTSLKSFDSMWVNSSDNLSYNFYLNGTVGGTLDDAVVYYNGTLLTQENSPVSWLGATPGTIYKNPYETKINDNGLVLVVGSCDDPSLGGTYDYYIEIIDPKAMTFKKLYMAGDKAPGTTETFYISGTSASCFATGSEQIDFNNNADVIFVARLTGPTANDYAIYFNNTILVREGDPVPENPGYVWDYVSSAEVGINNHGDYVYHASFDAPTTMDYMIVKNGEKFMQEGDVHPDMGGVVSYFSSNRVDISDHGDVLWYADFTDSDTTKDEAVFVNDKLLVQEGVTKVGSQTVTQIDAGSDVQRMSNDGRYYLIEVEVTDPVTMVETEGAILIDRGPWDILGGGTKGTDGVPMLRGWGSLEASSTVTIDLSYARPSALAHLIVGATAINAPFMCGTLVPAPMFIIFGLPVDANGNVSFTTTLPPTSYPGLSFYMQYVVGDPLGCAPFVLSNAVKGNLQ